MKNLRTHPETISSEEYEYFRELEILRSKYPFNPVILNYLAIGYEHLKQTEKATSLIFETCEKFPDYLFGRVAKAKFFYKEGKPKEAFEAIGNSLTIKQLYPHRDVFHVSEVKVFEDVLVTHFYFMRDLEQAEYHLKIIEKIALEMLENPKDPIYLSAQARLQFGKEYLGFRKQKKTKRK
jgi:tetratricopeptide (TPR) repeat protein